MDNDSELRVRIWEQAVKTQMHFNEMCVKSRQLGLSFVAAALALATYLLSKGGDYDIEMNVCGYAGRANISVFIVLIAAAGLVSVKTLDVGVDLLPVFHTLSD